MTELVNYTASARMHNGTFMPDSFWYLPVEEVLVQNEVQYVEDKMALTELIEGVINDGNV